MKHEEIDFNSYKNKSLEKFDKILLGKLFYFPVCLILCLSFLLSAIVLAEEKMEEQNPVSEVEAEFYNQLRWCHITVEKYDKTTGEVLAGAIFGLYAGEDIKLPDGSIAVKEGTLLETAVTDENGVAVFTADYPEGSYRIKELEAPETYDTAEEQLVEVKGDMKIRFYDERTPTEIFAVKKIPVSSYYEPHGDATFLFHLSGTDIYGEEHQYYKNLTFSASSPKTSDGQFYILEAHFEGLVPGNYTLEEISVIRYALTDIVEINETGTRQGNTVRFDLSGAANSGRAVFINEKEIWDDNSHTDCVVNIVKEGTKK